MLCINCSRGTPLSETKEPTTATTETVTGDSSTSTTSTASKLSVTSLNLSQADDDDDDDARSNGKDVAPTPLERDAYTNNENDTNSCPLGSAPLNSAQCEEAANVWRLPFSRETPSKYFPKGCYGKSGKSMYYNPHPTGSADPKSVPLCGNGICVVYPDGNYKRTCCKGFHGNPPNCQVNDACASNSCPDRTRCENIFHGYKCVCKEGYYGDGVNCQEAPESFMMASEKDKFTGIYKLHGKTGKTDLLQPIWSLKGINVAFITVVWKNWKNGKKDWELCGYKTSEAPKTSKECEIVSDNPFQNLSNPKRVWRTSSGSHLKKTQALTLGQRVSTWVGLYANLLFAGMLDGDILHKENRFVDIDTSITVLQLNSLDEKSKQISLLMRVDLSWVDNRVKTAAGNSKVVLSQDQSTPGKGDRANTGEKSYVKYWQPPLVWLKEANYETVFPSASAKKTGWKVELDKGRFIISFILPTTFSCNMKFIRYPFDQHKCPMTISFAEQSPEVRLQWADTPSMNDLQLEGFKVGKVEREKNSNGELVMKFDIKRDPTSALIHTLLPSSLLVILTWVSFYLHYESLAERIGIALTNLLASNIVFSGGGEVVTSGVTSMEVFVFLNIFFIALVMVENVVVTYIAPRRRKIVSVENVEDQQDSMLLKPTNRQDNSTDAWENTENATDARKRSGVTIIANETEKQDKTSVSEEDEPPKVHHIDKIAKVAMPLIYFISIGVYFLVEYNNS